MKKPIKYIVALWKRLPTGLQLSLQLFVLTRALISLFAAGSSKLIGHYSDAAHGVVNEPVVLSGNSLLDSWAHWDSSWYLHIAQHGYTGVPIANGQSDIAFFPLFPYIVRVLSWPFGFNTGVALTIGLAVTSAALVAAGYFLYRLVSRHFNAEVAKWSVVFLYLSPMGFVLSAFMSESLALLLLAMGLVWAAEGKWWRLAAVGFLLALARPTGLVVAGFFVLFYMAQLRWSIRELWVWRSLWILGPLAGVLILLLINFAVTHNPFGFLQAQAAWGRQLFHLDGPSGGIFTLQGLYLAGFGLAAIVLLSLYAKVIGWRYWVLGIALVLVPALSSLYGLIRYTSIVLPLYIILGWLVVKYPKLQLPSTITLAMIEGVHIVWWSVGMPIMQ